MLERVVTAWAGGGGGVKGEKGRRKGEERGETKTVGSERGGILKSSVTTLLPPFTAL